MSGPPPPHATETGALPAAQEGNIHHHVANNLCVNSRAPKLRSLANADGSILHTLDRPPISYVPPRTRIPLLAFAGTGSGECPEGGPRCTHPEREPAQTDPKRLPASTAASLPPNRYVPAPTSSQHDRRSRVSHPSFPRKRKSTAAGIMQYRVSTGNHQVTFSARELRPKPSCNLKPEP